MDFETLSRLAATSSAQSQKRLSDRYHIIRLIGRGSYGTAYLVEKQSSLLRGSSTKNSNSNNNSNNSTSNAGMYVAKEFSLFRDEDGMFDSKRLQLARSESALLAQLRHPNIVRYVDVVEEPDKIWLLMKYCEGGDLKSFIKRAQKKVSSAASSPPASTSTLPSLTEKAKATSSPPFIGVSESTIVRWAWQLCSALAYLHRNRVLHRDIKPANILLTSSSSSTAGSSAAAATAEGAIPSSSRAAGTNRSSNPISSRAHSSSPAPPPRRMRSTSRSPPPPLPPTAASVIPENNSNSINSINKNTTMMEGESFDVRLADFGVSKVMSHTDEAMTKIGTPLYFSPEMTSGSPYANKNDIWSLGVVLFELMLLRNPFDSTSQMGIFKNISTWGEPSVQGLRAMLVEKGQSRLGEVYSDKLLMMVAGMLQPDPGRRMSAAELCELALFDGLRQKGEKIK